MWEIFRYCLKLILLRGACALRRVLATASARFWDGSDIISRGFPFVLTMLTVFLVMRTVFLRVAFLLTLAVNVLRARFAHATAVLALRDRTAFLVHVDKLTICLSNISRAPCRGNASSCRTYLSGGRMRHDALERKPRRRTSRH